MCCLFGFIDYNHNLSGKQKNRLLRSLASAAEERGTDAAGIAYHAGGRLHIMKKAKTADVLRFRIPLETDAHRNRQLRRSPAPGKTKCPELQQPPKGGGTSSGHFCVYGLGCAGQPLFCPRR